MKKLILAFTLLIAGAQAEARSIQLKRPNYIGNLNKFYMQVGTDLEKKDITNGTVLVDTKKQVVSIELQPAFKCNGPEMCIQVMPMPVVIQAPIESITRGGCNEIVYKASRNGMPVDGPLVEITVIDNKDNYCEIFPIIPTVVNLHIMSPRPFFVQDHVMHGEALELDLSNVATH